MRKIIVFFILASNMAFAKDSGIKSITNEATTQKAYICTCGDEFWADIALGPVDLIVSNSATHREVLQKAEVACDKKYNGRTRVISCRPYYPFSKFRRATL